MRSTPQQLVPVDEVARVVGYAHAPAVVVGRLTDHVVPYWDGRVGAAVRATPTGWRGDSFGAAGGPPTTVEVPLCAFGTASSLWPVMSVAVSRLGRCGRARP